MGYIPRNKDLALCHTKVLVQVGEVHFIVKFWMAYGGSSVNPRVHVPEVIKVYFLFTLRLVTQSENIFPFPRRTDPNTKQPRWSWTELPGPRKVFLIANT